MAAKKSGSAVDSAQLANVSMTEEPDSGSMLRFRGKIGRCDGDILIDSGATSNYVSEEFVTKNRMKTTKTAGVRVQLADGTICECTARLPRAEVKIGPCRDKADFYVLPMLGNDVILGAVWLTTMNPQIDWQTKTITIQQGGHSIRLRPEGRPSTTVLNDGELTTLTAKQANKAIRQGARHFLAFIRPVSASQQVCGIFGDGAGETPWIQCEADRQEGDADHLGNADYPVNEKSALRTVQACKFVDLSESMKKTPAMTKRVKSEV
jgi:hypothetical protein